MRLLETVRPQLALRQRLSDEGIHLRVHYTPHQPAATKAPAAKQLQDLGYRVTLDPLADPA